jgi:uncharacterized protein (UPF0264 family)
MELHLPINDQTTRSSGSWRKAMVDTARKNGGRLLDHMDIAVLGSLSIVHAPTA